MFLLHFKSTSTCFIIYLVVNRAISFVCILVVAVMFLFAVGLLLVAHVASEEIVEHGLHLDPHYDDGEHNTAFDHQAILGKFTSTFILDYARCNTLLQVQQD